MSDPFRKIDYSKIKNKDQMQQKLKETADAVSKERGGIDPRSTTRHAMSFENVENMTKQSHKDECDIHNIIRQYDKTGLFQHVNTIRADYGDYTNINEYQESLNTVIKAQEDFMALPSHIRNEFSNDPGEFIEFVTNPKNQEKMVELGLALPNVEPGPIKVQIENAEPPAK